MKNHELKRKKIDVLKTLMIYKVQLKADQNTDKRLMKKIKNLWRDLQTGKTDIDEKLNKIKSVIFKNDVMKETNLDQANETNMEEKQNESKE